MTDTFPPDDVVAEIARRGTAPHWIAAAAGVDRRVLEAALDGDLAAMGASDYAKIGGGLGIGRRVLEVPEVAANPPAGRVLEAARLVVAADERSRVHDPDDPWVQAMRRAGVDVGAAYGIDGGRAA